MIQMPEHASSNGSTQWVNRESLIAYWRQLLGVPEL